MDLPRHWRLKEQRYKLVGAVCDDCDTKIFPPRQVCLGCRSRDLSSYRFSGAGEIWSHAVLHFAPEGFEEQEPYAVALVRLEEGPLVTAQLTDMDPYDAKIGMEVEMVTRKLREYGEDGFIVYGYKFRPKFD